MPFDPHPGCSRTREEWESFAAGACEEGPGWSEEARSGGRHRAEAPRWAALDDCQGQRILTGPQGGAIDIAFFSCFEIFLPHFLSLSWGKGDPRGTLKRIEKTKACTSLTNTEG